jgi:integrase
LDFDRIPRYYCFHQLNILSSTRVQGKSERSMTYALSYNKSMARTSENPRIINRTQRANLPTGREPYWHLIAEGQHLGYRKTGEKKGSWIARYYTRERGRRFHALGIADDTAPPNGTHVLSFQQALEEAQKWISSVSRADAAGVHIGPYTLKDAADDWLSAFDGSDASKRNSNGNLKHHILPVLGHIEVAKLTRQQIQEWHQNLAKKPPLKSMSKKSKTKFNPNDPETRRRRQNTANRILNDLKAILTLAYDNQHVASKAAWETVKRFENVDVAKNEYLTLDEAKAFIEGCPEDFRKLAQAALITGCRYGELASLRVNAYDVQIHSISLIQGKTGKLKHIFLTDEESEFFKKLVAGKQEEDLMFLRKDGEPWGKSNQQPRMTAVLKSAGISRHVRFHDLRHTFATLLAMNGTAIPLIANQLGHSGTRIAEKHYAHFSPSYISETIRKNKPRFGFIGDGAVEAGV